MKYIYYALFLLICLFIMYCFFKQKEKKVLNYINRKKTIETSRVELLRIQEQFIKLDINGSFKTCPNIREYIANIISVLNVYDDIENVKFSGRSLQEEYQLFVEYRNLTEKKQHLFMSASAVSNKLCYAINPKKYNAIIRKKKYEVRKMSLKMSMVGFVMKFEKLYKSISEFINKFMMPDVVYDDKEIKEFKNNGKATNNFVLQAS